MSSHDETSLFPRRPYDEYALAKQEVTDTAMVLASRLRSESLDDVDYIQQLLVAAADRVLQLREWILREDVA
jgi:hypothetical protein